MELKQRFWSTFHELTKVLIEPLWNWNEVAAERKRGYKGINRTFMELKLSTTTLKALRKSY